MGNKHLMLLQQESRYSIVEWDYKEKTCKDNLFYYVFIYMFVPIFLPFLPCLVNPSSGGMVSGLLLAISVL